LICFTLWINLWFPFTFINMLHLFPFTIVHNILFCNIIWWHPLHSLWSIRNLRYGHGSNPEIARFLMVMTVSLYFLPSDRGSMWWRFNPLLDRAERVNSRAVFPFPHYEKDTSSSDYVFCGSEMIRFPTMIRYLTSIVEPLPQAWIN